MAFVFTENPTFKAEVRVKWPTEAGDWSEQSFTGHFRLDKDVDFGAPTEAEDYDGAHREAIDRIRRVFVGFEGIDTPDGTPLAVSDETIGNLLGHVPIRMAVVATYVTEIASGGMRRGNFAPPPARSGAAGPGGKRKKVKRP